MMDLGEIILDDMHWIDLVQDIDECRAVANTIMGLRIL
jgi:hypothetical protein